MRLLSVLLILICMACGTTPGGKETESVSIVAGDGDGTTIIAGNNNETIDLNPGSQAEQDEQVSRICASCISNSFDGLTDAQCLGQFGVSLSECEVDQVCLEECLKRGNSPEGILEGGCYNECLEKKGDKE